MPLQKLLDEISVYWFTRRRGVLGAPVLGGFRALPGRGHGAVRAVVYPRDITRPSRREAERRFTDLRWFEELPRGGHFAALEQPESFAEQVRGFFRLLR
ncbi:alpha/beta fold hydrolase [Saccharopolyspora gregorii]|uniref:Epoxide hydrolase n=1 Tax=Saccharopolyspora gregorii TaxID=33914 RepID=A0ABP6S2R6_9PSEU